MADIKAEYLACPIRQVVSRFGDKWSMLVLYMLHTNETGVLQSVDSVQYSESPLYQKLCETKPEYGSNRRIQVKIERMPMEGFQGIKFRRS